MPDPFVVRPRGDLRASPVDAVDPPAPALPVAAPTLSRHPALEPLRPHLDDPAVTDLFVNGASEVYVDRGEGAVPASGWRARDETEARSLAVALIALGDRHLDDASPCVDVRLDGGLRVHAVLPPVATGGTHISIRIPRVADVTLTGLETLGTLTPPVRRWLEGVVARRENVLISGGAGSGKTTLLAAMLAAAPATDRIVTIEDVAELRFAHPHHVALEARQPNLEGAGGVGLARLVREALRMRPDRVVVGECRGEEVRELLTALNTGHDGGAGTLHASGLDEVPARLEALGALAGLDDRALARQVVSALAWVVHLERDPGGVRRVAGAARFVLASDRLAVERGVPWDG